MAWIVGLSGTDFEIHTAGEEKHYLSVHEPEKLKAFFKKNEILGVMVRSSLYHPCEELEGVDLNDILDEALWPGPPLENLQQALQCLYKALKADELEGEQKEKLMLAGRTVRDLIEQLEKDQPQKENKS